MPRLRRRHRPQPSHQGTHRPCLPHRFVLLYLALTKQLRLLPRLHLIPSTAVFLAIAAPWHILAALRTQPSRLPAASDCPPPEAGPGSISTTSTSPASSANRIPHDYGQVPIPLFWLLSASGSCPGSPSSPAASPRSHSHTLRRPRLRPHARSTKPPSPSSSGHSSSSASSPSPPGRSTTILPALPALALLAGGLLARADAHRQPRAQTQRPRLVLLPPRPPHHPYRRCLRILRHDRPPRRQRHRHRLTPRRQPRVLQPLPRPPLRPHRRRHGPLPRPPRRRSPQHARHRPRQLFLRRQDAPTPRTSPSPSP